MKTSRKWLQGYFEQELPDAEKLRDALTFSVAEVEDAVPGNDDLLDVNVLPDRASYLLSHRGVAKELSASLGLALAHDPLRQELPTYPETDRLIIGLDEEEGCTRYIGALVKGVRVGPSPAWLTEALESVGQRSINNIVDATNYVMLAIGQPLHAFDAGKLTAREGVYAISVRGAREEEKITTLAGEEYVLPEGTLLITDAHADGAPIGIAGIKGGQRAAIDETTTDIILESASFDGTSVRRAAQKLKLFTDASSRFQNKPSPTLAAYGMRDVLALVEKVAGGELVGVVDMYPKAPEPQTVSVSLARVNEVLGSFFTPYDVRTALASLDFSYTEVEDGFTVLVPFERNDLVIPEDLVEEIGRVVGYDTIESQELPVTSGVPDQARFRGIERIKDFLIERGFTEISTPSFAEEGEIELANPLQSDKPYLRASLVPSLRDALTRASSVAPRLTGPAPFVKLFEIGTVFTASGEMPFLAMGVVSLSGKGAPEVLKENLATLEQELFAMPVHARASLDGQLTEFSLDSINLEKLGDEYAPISVTLGAYKPFSPYPFALRDIAVWTPEGTEETEVTNVIIPAAGEHLARIDQFDRFEKEKDGVTRISYAFRLVFESIDRTLSDKDLDPAMERITEALNAHDGWEVR